MLLSKEVRELQSYNEISTNELYHYGVLGMRWGVRRGRTSQAYTKASKKLSKLSEKVEANDKRARRMTQKADAHRYSLLGSSKREQKYRAKAAKASYKSSKYMRKAVRWCNQMDKAFAGTKVKLTKAQVDLGKEYVKRLNMRTEIRTITY